MVNYKNDNINDTNFKFLFMKEHNKIKKFDFIYTYNISVNSLLQYTKTQKKRNLINYIESFIVFI